MFYGLNSFLYYKFYQTQDLKALAYFCLLHKYTKNSCFECDKKGGGYNLIRRRTGIQLATIKKYTPIIIEKGFAKFDDKGNFVMLGNNSIYKLLRHNEKIAKKLLKIELTNLIDIHTQLEFIIIHSNISKQIKYLPVLKRKRKLIEIGTRIESKKEVNVSLKQYKELKKLSKKDIDKLKNETIFYPTLSNNRISELVKQSSSISNGKYIKNKLKRKKLLFCNEVLRNFSYSTYKEYLSLKSNLYEIGSKLRYFNGIVYEQMSSYLSFTKINILKDKNCPFLNYHIVNL